MRFQKNVSQEIRAILSNDLRRYVNEVPMNARERSELREWVQSGRSPYDNGWHIATDAGIPRPGVKFCVSDFRQKSRMALENRANSGLNPLITESHGGQNGMRAGTA